jgi:hypothetical protein
MEITQMEKRNKNEPVVLPDVTTEPHPTANTIPEPPGTDLDTKQQEVSDVREVDEQKPTKRGKTSSGK